MDPVSCTGCAAERVKLGVELLGLGLGLGLDDFDFRNGTLPAWAVCCCATGRPSDVEPLLFGRRRVGMLEVGKSPCIFTGISPLACGRKDLTPTHL